MASLVLGLLLLVAAPVDRSAHSPQLWLCHGNVDALLKADPADWAAARQQLDVLKLYIGYLYKAPEESLVALAGLQEEYGFEVAVEMGGCLEFMPLDETNGEESAKREQGALQRYLGAGGRIDHLVFDGPMRRLLHPTRNKQPVPGFTSLDAAAEEVMDAAEAHRKVLPEVKIHILTNFPNWGYKGDVSYHARGPEQQDWGDYLPVLETVLRKAEERKIAIQGLQIDNPYEYAVGSHFSVKLTDPTKVDWIARILDLEQFAEEQGLAVTLITNSEEGGQTSDELFYERSLAFVDLYRRRGGTPAGYVLQSWYPYPKAVVPEGDGHSMTALLRAAGEMLRGALR